MRVLKQSTAYDLMLFMTDSADHVSGKTGLTLTITASKAGAAFASVSPTVTERGNGWYALALTSSHTDTVGDLVLRATGTGADPTDLAAQVRANVLGDTLPANVAQISGDATAADNAESFFDGTGYAGTGNVIPTVTNLANLPTMPTDWITAAGLSAAAVAEVQSGLATASVLAAAKAVTDKLDTAIEQDGGVYRFTVNALEQGPAGGGGGGGQLPADGLDLIEVEPATDDEPAINARQMLSLLGAAVLGKLSGANTSTITVRAANDPLTTRIIVSADGDGNRTAVALSPPA